MEDNLKNLNIKETLFANIANILFGILEVYVVFAGLGIVQQIVDEQLRVLAIIVIALFTLRYIRLHFVVVYNAKDGGLIRYD